MKKAHPFRMRLVKSNIDCSAMTLMPVMAVTIAPAIVDPEHAVDASDNSANARADGSPDSATHRPRRAVAAVSAFIGSAFHPPDHPLRMRGDGKRQQGKRRGDERETAVC